MSQPDSLPSTKKVTPGPWKCSPRGDGWHITSEAKGQWTSVAIVHGMLPHNARAIAALPDLLELARQYASECSGCEGTGKAQVLSANGYPAGEIDCADCADIRTVIDKAEGRQP